MAKFKIVVDYDPENIEVNSIKVTGGFQQPSLEMSDLLSDVQHLLAKEGDVNFKGYYNSIPSRFQKQKKATN